MTSEIDALLDFARKSRLPQGFGYLRADGTVDPEAPLETWINARMTHVFGLALLSGRTDLAPLVAHGVEALWGPLHDETHGGWYATSARVGVKGAYEHAFVVLAASTAKLAGAPAAESLLAASLTVWEQRFWDGDQGAAVEEHEADWSQLDGYRGANANMHGVEAMLAAADAVDAEDTADRLRHKACQVVERFVHGEARSRDWRLPEHFDDTWTAQLDYNRDLPADPFRPFGVTVGHQFEWARLALHLRTALGPQAPEWLLPDARELYAAARDRGWAADGLDGFAYTLDWDDKPVVVARMHWVLAEAISAAAVLHRVTGDAQYARDLEQWWAHARARFVDPSTGSWHHELSAEGAVSDGTWKGQPDAYHVLQALLLTDLPLAPSVAAALQL